MPAPSSSVPMPAVGIGWRHPHYAALLDQQPALDFIEVHSENFFAPGGAALAVLREGRTHYPVSLHGVGLSLGAAAGLDPWHLDQLAHQRFGHAELHVEPAQVHQGEQRGVARHRRAVAHQALADGTVLRRADAQQRLLARQFGVVVAPGVRHAAAPRGRRSPPARAPPRRAARRARARRCPTRSAWARRPGAAPSRGRPPTPAGARGCRGRR